MATDAKDIGNAPPVNISGDQQDTARCDDDTDTEDLPEGTSLFSSAMRIISTPFSGTSSPIARREQSTEGRAQDISVQLGAVDEQKNEMTERRSLPIRISRIYVSTTSLFNGMGGAEAKFLSKDLRIIRTEVDMDDVPPGNVPNIGYDVVWTNLNQLFCHQG